jgi:hypothetical protein
MDFLSYTLFDAEIDCFYFVAVAKIHFRYGDFFLAPALLMVFLIIDAAIATKTPRDSLISLRSPVL